MLGQYEHALNLWRGGLLSALIRRWMVVIAVVIVLVLRGHP